MDLDQLKTVWQKTSVEQGRGYFIGEEQLRQLIQKSSNSTISEVKSQIKQKAVFAGAVSILLLLFSVVAFQSSKPMFSKISNVETGIFYVIFGLVIAFISLFNAYSYQRIQRIELFEPDTKTSIFRVIQILKSAINVKIFSDTFVLPVTILVLTFTSYIRGIGAFTSLKTILFACILSIGFGVFSYFYTKRGQHKRYGFQLKALENSLKELDEF